MILNGKAKKDFILWLNNQPVAPYEVMLDDIPKCYLNSLIIEWFDSVGIYITSDYFELNKGFYSEILNENFEIVKPTRQEALAEAIKKANEIYNEKYSISQ